MGLHRNLTPSEHTGDRWIYVYIYIYRGKRENGNFYSISNSKAGIFRIWGI